MTEDEKTPPIKLTRNFETAKYQNDYYKPELILHPSERTSNADLLIEVVKNNELQAVIPCEKSYITSNVPAIAGKYREGSNFRDENNDGISVYELEFDFDPQLVCDFIEVIYSGNLIFNVKNAIAFCILADCLNCAEFFDHGKKWVRENMKSEMIVDAWNYGEWFHESCLEFVKNSDKLEFDQVYNQIGKLNLNKFNEFTESINKSKKIESCVLIHLKLEWISEQSSVDRYIDSLLLKIDISSIDEKHRLRYYLKIYDKLESESVKKKCREHMFKEIDMAIKIPKVDHYSGYNYFKSSDEENKESFPNCASYKHDGEQYLILYSDEIQKDIPVISWRIQVLDFGGFSAVDNMTDYFLIGIHDVAADEISEDGTFDSAAAKRAYHSWNMSDLTLTTHSEQDDFRECARNSYGSNLKLNDIIEVKFYQHKHQLEFLVNGVSQGLAFSELPESKYEFQIKLMPQTEIKIVQ